MKSQVIGEACFLYYYFICAIHVLCALRKHEHKIALNDLEQ